MTGSVRIAFRVRAVDGECQAVPDLELRAVFRYAAASPRESCRRTDAEGCAHFDDEHPEAPLEARLFVGDDDCGRVTPLEPGGCHILEL